MTNGAEVSVKVLGMAGEGTCECCGTYCPKRRVAVLLDGQTEALWGSICAGKLSGRKARQVEAEALSVEEEKRAAAFRAAMLEQKRLDDAFGEWLAKATGKVERFAQIQAMGGYVAARDAYRAKVA